MPRPNRRSFIKHTLATAATVTIAGTKSSGKVLGANDTIRIAVAGLNGRGGSHVDEFGDSNKAGKNVEIVYLVDPDQRTYKKRQTQLAKLGRPEAKTFTDIRKALEDKELNAVSIATPNHWHSLMTIWACEAGKDVYVEKPCSHNIHEGRIAVEMARKHKRVVQHGTQSRSSQQWEDLASTREVRQARQVARVARAVLQGRRHRARRTPAATSAPSRRRRRHRDLDFNIWLGPAQEQAVSREPRPLPLALVLGLRQRRHGQPGRPRDGQGPLGHPRRGLAEVGHQLRRSLRQQRPGADAQRACVTFTTTARRS